MNASRLSLLALALSLPLSLRAEDMVAVASKVRAAKVFASYQAAVEQATKFMGIRGDPRKAKEVRPHHEALGPGLKELPQLATTLLPQVGELLAGSGAGPAPSDQQLVEIVLPAVHELEQVRHALRPEGGAFMFLGFHRDLLVQAVETSKQLAAPLDALRTRLEGLPPGSRDARRVLFGLRLANSGEELAAWMDDAVRILQGDAPKPLRGALLELLLERATGRAPGISMGVYYSDWAPIRPLLLAAAEGGELDADLLCTVVQAEFRGPALMETSRTPWPDLPDAALAKFIAALSSALPAKDPPTSCQGLARALDDRDRRGVDHGRAATQATRARVAAALEPLRARLALPEETPPLDADPDSLTANQYHRQQNAKRRRMRRTRPIALGYSFAEAPQGIPLTGPGIRLLDSTQATLAFVDDPATLEVLDWKRGERRSISLGKVRVAALRVGTYDRSGLVVVSEDLRLYLLPPLATQLVGGVPVDLPPGPGPVRLGWSQDGIAVERGGEFRVHDPIFLREVRRHGAADKERTFVLPGPRTSHTDTVSLKVRPGTGKGALEVHAEGPRLRKFQFGALSEKAPFLALLGPAPDLPQAGSNGSVLAFREGETTRIYRMPEGYLLREIPTEHPEDFGFESNGATHIASARPAKEEAQAGWRSLEFQDYESQTVVGVLPASDVPFRWLDAGEVLLTWPRDATAGARSRLGNSLRIWRKAYSKRGGTRELPPAPHLLWTWPEDPPPPAWPTDQAPIESAEAGALREVLDQRRPSPARGLSADGRWMLFHHYGSPTLQRITERPGGLRPWIVGIQVRKVLEGALSEDGRFVALAGEDATLLVASVASPRSYWKVEGVSGGRALTFTPDGEHLFVDTDAGARIYRLGPEGPEERVQVPRRAETYLATDGRALFARTEEGKVELLDLSGKVRSRLPARSTITSLAVTTRHGPVAVGTRDGLVALFRPPRSTKDKAWKGLRRFRLAGGAGASRLTLAPDGSQLVAHVGGEARFLDTRTGKRWATLPGVEAVTFSPDSRLVTDGQRVWALPR